MPSSVASSMLAVLAGTISPAVPSIPCLLHLDDLRSPLADPADFRGHRGFVARVEHDTPLTRPTWNLVGRHDVRPCARDLRSTGCFARRNTSRENSRRTPTPTATGAKLSAGHVPPRL